MCRMTGYSSEMPLAPRMVRAVRQISSASRTLLSLPRLTCSGRSVPGVLAPAEVQGEQHALGELERHVGELLLGELEAGDRPAELLARRRRTPGPPRSEDRAAPIAPQTMP